MTTKNEVNDELDLSNVVAPGAATDDDPLFDTTADDFGSDLTPAEVAEDKTDDADPEPDPEPDAAEPDVDGEPKDPVPEPVEPEPAAAARDADRDTRIPKSRFDQVNERRKAAERQLEELRAAQAAKDPAVAAAYDFSAKEREYMEAVLDGETDKALAIRTEIRTAEQTVMEARLRETQVAAQEQTKTDLDLRSTITELQTQYPQFDGNNEAFNQDITDEALELFEGFKTRGYDPVSAMNRAVRYVAKANDLDASAAAAPAPAAAPASAPAPKASREQMQRKLDAAAAQPPVTPGRTVDDTPDIFAMPEEQFDKLSKQDEAILRGDFV